MAEDMLPRPIELRPEPPPPPARARGDMVGRYLILDELGRGGMGAVFAAWDTDLGRRVALKLLLSPDTADGRPVRLRREAQAMARLSHPNVVTVYDVGSHEGQTFIAMELIDGGTLSKWLSEGPHPASEVLPILLAAGRGLAAAHAAGLVHRDFKPGNVLIAKDGRVVVTDFGIARADTSAGKGATSTPLPGAPGPVEEVTVVVPPLPMSARPPAPSRPESSPPPPRAALASALALPRPQSTPPPRAAMGSSPTPTVPVAMRRPFPSGSDGDFDERVTLDERVTRDGAVLGTIGYMAPEQVIKRTDDARSDQFAFAVTTYRALYGKPPFAMKRLFAYAESLRTGPLPPPKESPVPRWIWPILKRGMSFDPADRFPSMEALLEALEQDPTVARRRRLTVLGAGVIAALALSSYALSRRSERRACSAEAEAIFDVWSAPAREKVVATLVAARAKVGPRMTEDAPARVAAALDRYAAGHRAAREQSCIEGLDRAAATAELRGRRAACFDRGKEQLAALVEQLASADEQTAPSALRAAIALPRPETCVSPPASERPLPANAASRGSVLEIRKTESRALALRLTGRPNDALAEERRAVELARASGDARLEAAALKRSAELCSLVGDFQAAVDAGVAAISAAERGGDDVTAGSAAAFMAKTFDNRLGQPKEAERWLAFAEAKLARAGQNDELEGEVLEARAIVLERASRLGEALPLYDRLLAIEEKAWGAVSERVLAVLNGKAIALGALGRFEEAIALQQRTISLGEELYGASDLALAKYHHNLSRLLISLGRYREAEQAAQRAYDLRLVLGKSSPMLCWPLSNLAAIALLTGRPARAIAQLDEAMAIVREHPQAVPAIEPSLLMVRGEAEVALGRFEEAAANCGKSLAILEHDGPLTPEKATEEPLTCLGVATIGLGRLEEGIEHLERAATLLKRDEPSTLALTRFALAKALHSAGREPARARALAEQAQAELRKYPELSGRLQEVERWLAAR